MHDCKKWQKFCAICTCYYFTKATIPSCHVCFKSQIEHCCNGMQICICADCMGWDFCNHPKSKYFASLPHEYPITYDTNVVFPMAHTVQDVCVELSHMTFD